MTRSRRRDESGAVLVLALMFMVVTALVVTGLAAWSGNDIKNIGHLKTGRSALYAADGATQAAIWNIRYSYPSSVSPGFCPSASPSTSTDPFTLDNESIDSWCVTTVNEGSIASRIVTVSSYPAGQCTVSGCTGNPYVLAQVTYNDYSSLTKNDCSSAGAQTSCGTGMTVNSWIAIPGLT